MNLARAGVPQLGQVRPDRKQTMNYLHYTLNLTFTGIFLEIVFPLVIDLFWQNFTVCLAGFMPTNRLVRIALKQMQLNSNDCQTLPVIRC